MALELCARVDHDDLRHTKYPSPCRKLGVPDILCGLVIVSANLANKLKTGSPPDTVKPVAQATREVLDLGQVETDDVVETVGPGDGCWSSCLRLLMGFTCSQEKFFLTHAATSGLALPRRSNLAKTALEGCPALS